MLENRDYTLIIDKSGSMATPDQKGGRTRWVAAEESTFALASKCEQFDPDGITLYTFSGRFKRYENVTSKKVMQIFQENDPSGTTDLASVLKHATENYFQRKAAGETKENGETILVITDGEPDDRKAVMKVIIETSRRMDKDEELAISFIQVGTDPHATRFLKVLDDEMQSAGAKFDICDTITMDDMEDYSLSEVLLNAIID
ncbi:vWA domain-containing protein [Calothrix sp. CCY 0018]|uniref:vWA domain-containing protein n=1 Tax=Calothrix sp. CCY 0018 TaxID=3103864 RepID=UPI0039C5DC34